MNINELSAVVNLRVVEPRLPEIENLETFLKSDLTPPPQIIGGVLHQGRKMVLGGTSKSNKSWCLLNLAMSVASGQEWLGRPCARAKALYINFELHAWALYQRVVAIEAARPECTGLDDMLAFWNLRGHNADLTLLRPKLEEQLTQHEFGLIILDPAYKLLGDRDENSNGDIAGLMNEFEGLAQRTGAAIVIAHHFAKGDSMWKDPMARLSGAGAWARDADTIMSLTPHEEDDCFTVSAIMRNLPPLSEFVVQWDYPVLRRVNDLDPDSLRRPQAINKVCRGREFVEVVLGNAGLSFSRVVEVAAEKLDMSLATTKRYLSRLKEAGVIDHIGSLYWARHQPSTRSSAGEGSGLTSL